jgi:hypothetical protein
VNIDKKRVALQHQSRGVLVVAGSAEEGSLPVCFQMLDNVYNAWMAETKIMVVAFDYVTLTI